MLTVVGDQGTRQLNLEPLYFKSNSLISFALSSEHHSCCKEACWNCLTRGVWRKKKTSPRRNGKVSQVRWEINLLMNSTFEGPRALHPGVWMGSKTTWQHVGGNPAMNKHPIQWGIMSMFLSYRNWLRYQPVEPLGSRRVLLSRQKF